MKINLYILISRERERIEREEKERQYLINLQDDKIKLEYEIE